MSGKGSTPDPLQETKAEQEFARVAIEQFNDYQTRFRPLEDQLMARVHTTDGMIDQGRGRAGSATQQQFSAARQQVNDGLASRGLAPNSGAYQGAMEELGRSGALSGGMNMAGAEQSLVDQERYGLMGVTQIGRGQSGTALQMMGQQASMSQQQAASDASAALNKSLANQQLIGQIAGSGTAVALHGYEDGWFGGSK